MATSTVLRTLRNVAFRPSIYARPQPLFAINVDAGLPCRRFLFGNNASSKQEQQVQQDASGSQQPSAEEQTAGNDAAGDPLAELQKSHAQEKNKLEDQIKDIDDKYKRSLAELENLRIRLTKQIEEAKVYGIQGFCKDMLEVADVLQIAVTSVPEKALKESSGDLQQTLKQLFEGVKMTEQQLQTVFRRHGLTQINPIGEKFNPNEHEALFEAPDPEKQPGTVCVVTKIGYKLRDRTLRPALVGVVKKAPPS